MNLLLVNTNNQIKIKMDKSKQLKEVAQSIKGVVESLEKCAEDLKAENCKEILEVNEELLKNNTRKLNIIRHK